MANSHPTGYGRTSTVISLTKMVQKSAGTMTAIPLTSTATRPIPCRMSLHLIHSHPPR